MKQPRKKTKNKIGGAGLYFVHDPPTPRPQEIEGEKLAEDTHTQKFSRQKLLTRVPRSWAEKASAGREASSPVPPSVKLKTRFGPRPGYESQSDGFHVGLDFAGPPGTPVFAVRPGRVMFVARDEGCFDGFVGYGNVVVLYHPEDDLWSCYGHLEAILVKPGAMVEAGQVIGQLGNTTNGRLISMGFRLHLEVRVRGTDGLPPFPGPHLVNNRDPEPWLESLGIRYDADGCLQESDRQVA